MKLNNILDFLTAKNIPYEFYGDSNQEIHDFCSLYDLKNNSLTWARDASNVDILVANTFERVLIVIGSRLEELNFSQIVVSNPHRVFFQVLAHFFDNDSELPAIDPTAVVKSINIGKNVSIGPNSYIGKNVVIGDNVRIASCVSVEGKVKIGNNSIIEAGVVIGVCGYGHYKDENNVSVRVPHLGGVQIGSFVAIGANSTIARGCLGDTIIEDYVKIDNLCHIAHNVKIKSRTMITACSEVSGSVTIEEDVWIGPASAITNGVIVGKNSFFGIGTIATKSVPEGKVVVGVPAKVLRDNV